jgi:hypothetical protein
MKLYNEKQIGSILKRAAELSQDETGPNASGLSIEELQQVGSEAGLDPNLILKAAAELHSSGPEREKNFFGGPVSYSNDIVLDGEIDNATWEEMIAAIRGTFKEPGVVSTRENVFEWTGQSETKKAQVTALVSNGKTKVSIFWADHVAAIPLFIPSVIGTIIALPITFESLGLSGLAATAVILSTFASLFMLGRFATGKIVDGQTTRLKQLETSLDLIASKKALRASRERAKPPITQPVAALESEEGSLNIDLDEADSEEPSPVRNRTRE